MKRIASGDAAPVFLVPPMSLVSDVPHAQLGLCLGERRVKADGTNLYDGLLARRFATDWNSVVQVRSHLPLALLLVLALCVPATTVRGDDGDTYGTLTFRVQGLFQPDRVEAFKKYLTTREQFSGDKPPVVLEKIDYDTNLATLRVDFARTGLKGRSLADQLRWFDETVYYPSRGLYRLKGPSEKPREKLQFVEIRVAGLDCLACGLGAYEAVQNVEGVETATASFKTGLVTAWIDPEKTDRSKLEEALKQRGVQIAAVP